MESGNKSPSAKPQTWVLPPIPYALAIIGGWWLDRHITPWPFDLGGANQVVAVLFATTGLILMLLTGWELYKHRTTVNPYSSASHLCISGIFAYSRNPIYVGDWLLLIAASVWFKTYWPLIFSPLVWLIIRYGVIRHEEEHLATKFGQQYWDYQCSVRRWL